MPAVVGGPAAVLLGDLAESAPPRTLSHALDSPGGPLWGPRHPISRRSNRGSPSAASSPPSEDVDNGSYAVRGDHDADGGRHPGGIETVGHPVRGGYAQ